MRNKCWSGYQRNNRSSLSIPKKMNCSSSNSKVKRNKGMRHRFMPIIGRALTREEYTFARGKYQEEVAAYRGGSASSKSGLPLSQVSDCAKKLDGSD